ncbi:MAG: hypothetical protein QXP32_08180, partial [Nitrososphaeria archaeon]
QIADGIRRGLNWIGIKVDGKLVSIGSVNLTGWAGLIGTVATHVSYRNRGYATTIISELMRRIIEKKFGRNNFCIGRKFAGDQSLREKWFQAIQKILFYQRK